MPELLLKSGDLAGCLNKVQDLVRNQPANAAHRIFLFQLYCISGQWDRAQTQLEVAASLDSEAGLLSLTYRTALAAEKSRQKVFAGESNAHVFGKPRDWVAFLVESLRAEQSGQLELSLHLQQKALEIAPAVPGKLLTNIDGELQEQSFDWFADADTRLGPIIETFLNGVYTWVPIERIKGLRIEAPEDLRDLVWARAEITWANGGISPVFIPARYPGSEDLEQPLLALGRKTEWQGKGESYRGLGMRMWATDGMDVPMFEARGIEFDCPTAVELDGELDEDESQENKEGAE